MQVPPPRLHAPFLAGRGSPSCAAFFLPLGVLCGEIRHHFFPLPRGPFLSRVGHREILGLCFVFALCETKFFSRSGGFLQSSIGQSASPPHSFFFFRTPPPIFSRSPHSKTSNLPRELPSGRGQTSPWTIAISPVSRY